jgi:hypothetical protein
VTTLQASIDAVASGKGITVALQTFTGGEVTSEVARDRVAGERFDRGIPAPPSVGNITTGVTYDEAIHGPILPILRASVGDASEWSVGHIRRDGNGNRIGLTTYTCLLVRVTPPEANTNGGADKATLELEWAPNGAPVG